jgi:hypothetical protein
LLLRHVADPDVRATLRYRRQIDRRRRGAWGQRQHDPHFVAIDLDITEELIPLFLSGGQLRFTEFCVGRRDRKAELVAVHVIARGDLVTHFKRVGFQNAGCKSERLLRLKQLRFRRMGQARRRQ